MKALIVIPARMGSTRFPGKPLAQIAGRTMIERVWRLAMAVPSADRVIVATDHPEIAAAARAFGAESMITSEGCRTGSDRVAETAAKLDERFDVVFSLQGDALLTPPWVIEAVISELRADPAVRIATPAVRLRGDALQELVDAKARGSTTGTTVVFDKRFNALYFSKGLIPHAREGALSEAWCHIGLYGYRTQTLEEMTTLPEGTLEGIEKLEQLRALEHGIAIRIVPVDYRGRTHTSVDSPEDVAVVEDIIAREGELVAL